MEKMSLWKWIETLDVAKISAYTYIKMYQDELQEMGCIEVKRTPKRQRIFILDENCILEFFSKHGIFLKELKANV